METLYIISRFYFGVYIRFNVDNSEFKEHDKISPVI